MRAIIEWLSVLLVLSGGTVLSTVIQRSKVAQCVFDGVTGKGNVKGVITLSQDIHGPLRLSGELIGLDDGPHGFHFHMKGNLSAQCSGAGGHFNPFKKNHGSPYERDRHVGDLGNIYTIGGVTRVQIIDTLASIQEEPANVLNRAIVVHAMGDDLGDGGDEESLKTGNAGARLGCCLIKETPGHGLPQLETPVHSLPQLETPGIGLPPRVIGNNGQSRPMPFSPIQQSFSFRRPFEGFRGFWN